MPALNSLVGQTVPGGGLTYDQAFHIVHIYVVEPHPQTPDLSPYSGVVWEAQYSQRRQALNHGARVTTAAETQALLTGNQTTLVDDLTPGARNNPLWCTYGTCPNCAYLIRQDGRIHTVQTWTDAVTLRQAMDNLRAGN